jgi:hypothetical protein
MREEIIILYKSEVNEEIQTENLLIKKMEQFREVLKPFLFEMIYIKPYGNLELE